MHEAPEILRFSRQMGVSRMTGAGPERANFPQMANAIRALSMDAVEKANSGHPGMPMGMAPNQQMMAQGGGSYMTDESGEAVKLPGPAKYEDTLKAARQMVNDDPKRVAQVVKSWVADNA